MTVAALTLAGLAALSPLTAQTAPAKAGSDVVTMSKFEADVGIFLSSVEKMQQAMQLFADVEAREKKKVAERLAEKAARAAEDAATPA